MQLRILLLCVLPLCFGFEWPGRLARLRREVGHADVGRRAEAATELARYRPAQAHDALLGALEDNDANVRLAAAQSATTLRLLDARPIFLDWLDDPDPAAKAAAQRALASLELASAAPATPATCKHDEDIAPDQPATPAGPSASAEAQPTVALPQTLALLAQLTTGEDDALAAHALDALRRWATPEAAKVVAGLLASPIPERRVAAAAALAAFDDDETRRLLRYVLMHASTELTLAAIGALAEVGDQRDAIALVRLSERKRWPIPAAASFALARFAQRGMIKKHAMGRTLCAVARSADPYVRANIAAALAALGAEGCAGECITALPPNEAARERAEIDVTASDGQTPLRHRLVAVRFADGAVTFAYTDANARLMLRSVPNGPLSVEDPTLVVLDPIPDEKPSVTADARAVGEQPAPRPPSSASP